MGKFITEVRKLFVFNDLVRILLLAAVFICTAVAPSSIWLLILSSAFAVSLVLSWIRTLDKEGVAIKSKRQSKFYSASKIVCIFVVSVCFIASFTLLCLHNGFNLLPVWSLSIGISVSSCLFVFLCLVAGIKKLIKKKEMDATNILYIMVFSLIIVASVMSIWLPQISGFIFLGSGIFMALIALWEALKDRIESQHMSEFSIRDHRLRIIPENELGNDPLMKEASLCGCKDILNESTDNGLSICGDLNASFESNVSVEEADILNTSLESDEKTPLI